MQTLKNKTLAFIVTLILATSTAGTLLTIPTATAHSPPWTFPGTAYLMATPDPIGVGQTGAIMMWVDYPLPSSVVTNNIRRINYALTITSPTGKVTTQHWDVISDTTGIQYYKFTPTELGVYTLKFEYPGQTYTWSGTYNGDIYQAASRTITWNVQEEQIANPVTSFPLPTEYWTHPIEGQNTDWWIISSNWLGTPYIVNRYQPYGAAPNSAHVMWSKAIQEGGVVGGMMGPSTDDPVKTFYMGGSYNVRWSNPLIMNGKLYYELPWGNSGSGGGYVCNDLRTGEELWRVNTTATGTSLVPNFGFLYAFDDGNQHGVLPNGLLFTSNFARAYDPDTGVLTTMNITNVPSGTSVVGLKGEILRYTLTNLGTTAAPKWYLTEWNSTKLWASASGLGPSNWYSGQINASLPSRYDFNKTVTLMNGASWSISQAKYGSCMLLVQGNFGGRADTYYGGNWYGANVTCISLKPESMGSIVWAKYFPPAPNNGTRSLVAVDWDTGVFIFEDQETLVHYGFSLTDGSAMWGPTSPVDQFDYFRSTTRVAYGNFYYAGYGGILYCYDSKTGKLEWTYGNGGPGNSTSSGLTTAWGHYPLFMPCIADGKIFLDTTEHSPDSPYYKGAEVRAVNATSGAELWTLSGWGTGMDANYDIVADGYFTYLNSYDEKVYVIGKGPSSLTVDAPQTGFDLGKSVIIRGTVMDIAAGTQQDEQTARFPNGVPAVSDASQQGWMEYVYMQKPRPSDTIGVTVNIDVIDANGNYRNIGQAQTDQSGMYSFTWKPDIEGTFTVVTTFAGSESYYPSFGETTFVVDPVASTPTPTTTQQAQSVADLYFVPAIAALFVVIIVVGLLNIVILRKRP